MNNTSILTTLIIVIIVYLNLTTIDAKPFITKITKNVNDDIINDNDYNTGDNNELTSYDEIRRIFQEDPIHDKQPTKTTSSPMTTTTVKPEKEEEEEENDLGLNEADDESSPCSGGGTIFTYTIHSTDEDDDSQTDSGRQDYDTVGAEEDYDYYQMIPWFRRDQNRRPSRGSYRKPMRGTWYSSDHYFPFYIPH